MRLRVSLPESTFEWESPAETFRVGRGDDCALRFAGEAAKFASWEHAEFAQKGSENYITDLESSNGTYVDGARITSPVPLRLGMTVQIGRAGPRLEVLALNPTKVAVGAPGAIAPLRVASASAEPLPDMPLAPRRRSRQKRISPQLVAAAAAGIFVVAVVYVAKRPASNPDQSIERSQSAAKSQATSEEAASKKVKPKREERKPERPEPAAAEPALPPEPPADQTLRRALAAYRLVVVEDPEAQASWPLAGSIAVGERTLLTTATVALELSKYVEKGFTVSVMKPPQGDRTRVAERRIHAAFQQADRAEQLFFDAALLYTDETLSDSAPLAASAELDQLERGQPLTCVAVEHEFEAIDRFQELELKSYPGKTFAVTGLPPQPGPRLLHIRGAFSDKSAGSPIVDEHGGLIALYCEPAPGEGATAGLALHYAKIIDPALIERGLSKPDDSIWVPLHTTTNVQEKSP